MSDVFICAAVRTPVGKYGGVLSSVRTDDLAAIPIKALVDGNQGLDWSSLDDVILGCANQAGEDNRNVARMALLLAGLPESVSGVTMNRLCGSGMEAVGAAARFIRAGEADLILAGGVESMSRAPFVMGKSTEPFSRKTEIYDTTIGWRFVNQAFEKRFGAESMIETAENIASEYRVSREDQDRFAFWSQEKAQIAQKNGSLSQEITPVNITQQKGGPIVVDRDEHPRKVTLEKLAELKPITNANGTITAGNSSGINDGAAAVLVASENAVKKHRLTPLVKILGMSTAGVPPRIMGMGPVPATKKLLDRLKLTLNDMDILEINEAFAAQALGCIRELGLADNDARINPLGGAIALGHPLGMSGARILVSACLQLQRNTLKRALCTMCVGVGQGIAMVIERA
ncbi:MAG: 3-oxoadipyl-CoA thiolase [bacterium]|nr:3-oxoadipyl-CoA thiolase [bacterium]